MSQSPMSQDKMSRKELKAPDEFQKLGAQALPFLVQHQKTIVGAIIIFVVVGLGVGLIKYMGERGEEQANSDLGAALKDIGKDVSPLASPQPGETAFKTETEKNDALIKSLTEFRGKSQGTKASSTAALPLGHAYLREGKSQEG